METANQRSIGSDQPGVNPLLHLRLLGGLSLECDGESFRGRAAQKRRLALLAFLAAAPHRTASRDRLMGLLWPEKDEEQARHLLSAAVYEIRKDLGEGVLITRGDDLVLDASTFLTDLDQFRAALDEGHPERAVDLYAGPFLDGVFINGSTGFDEWVETERGTIAHLFRRALAETAEQHETRGHLDAAVDAWRRLAAEDRYDCRVALRLLKALAAAGHHAGALQFARVHEALLREEFDTRPTPEFCAAAEAIRAAADNTVPEPAPETQPGTGSRPSTATPLSTESPPSTEPRPSTESRTAPPRSAGRPMEAEGEAEEQAEIDDVETAMLTVVPEVVGRAYRWRPPRPAGQEGATRFTAPLMVVAILVVGSMTAGALLQGRTGKRVEGATTIAVLPFEPGDGVDEAFAHGLTEEVLGVLGAVEDVRVPVWSAAASLRGVDARTAAAMLGVDHVLEGTVRREEDQLRVRVWLSDAEGMRVWTERYDRSAGPVFQAHDDIARAVLAALEVKLDIARGVLSALDVDPGSDAVRPLDGGTRDPIAFSHYVRGRHAWYRRSPEGFAWALGYFQSAVEQDDGYARAYAGLADTYNLLGAHIYGLLPPDTAFPRARWAAERAIDLAPRLAQGHLALAQTRASYERDWEKAEASFREAIRLDPQYAEAHHWYSLLLVATGRPDEALTAARRAIMLDSVSPHPHANLGRLQYYRGDYEAARTSFQRALALEAGTIPAQLGLCLVLLETGQADEAAELLGRILEASGQSLPVVLALRGHALGRAGRLDEARHVLDQLTELERTGTYVPPEYPALIHVALSDLERAMDGLERAFEARSAAIVFLAVDPLTEPLRTLPRFQELVREAGL